MTMDPRLSLGVSGLDSILAGGVLPERSYLVRGGPGTGKTILGLQYLLAGIENDETALYLSFEEPPENIIENAARLVFDVSGVEFLDLTPSGELFSDTRPYSIFEPDEVEVGTLTETISETVDRLQPDRIVLDSVNRMEALTADRYQFRQQLISMLEQLTDVGGTVLFTTQPTSEMPDDELQFLVDGTLELEFGPKGRTVQITKLRGSSFQSGRHTVRITDTGMVVYPKLVPGEYEREFVPETVSSGVVGLDSLLNGGIERGTVTVLSGSTGVGKTTTGTSFAVESATRGERAAVYLFEESTGTFRHRCSGIGMPVDERAADGTLAIEAVEPVTISPDEFAHAVREEVETHGTQFVMIDGISGYRLSMRSDDDDIVTELHSLCRYLKNMGVTTVLLDDVSNITGNTEVTSHQISYLADNVIMLRYLEVDSELKKAVGVLKKRASDFERSLRSFEITADGIQIGEKLTGLRGILSGSPEMIDRM
ncbi:circadian clock protein KaiC [Halohasta litchfieldiae]|jgi:circadian clock protein KaiC|uniref:non-specific serine/threonine protein kinase n=1 Tax=Halohasta litchfieldiae TaxID=1073996 RepID=A0A1H6UBY0_9EURY|nr:ATPase domain-containing protein [Halohasta litchfieldiae]ATW89055.1 circadian clock protein KaiC [Halohasta litchfieldiae]SEI88154.1 circadian clock protein KaiC [Halohasta litchfieldiae]